MVNITKADAINNGTMEQFKLAAALHNRFDIEVIDGVTGELKCGAVAFNIILDALWTRLSNGFQWFASIAYGSGTGTLAASRVGLFTQISAKTAGTLTVDYTHFPDGYVSFRKQIQIGAGEITGQVLREVGISYDNTANHLMTHALLKDMNGNTVSITVGELDVINIYATVFVRFATAGYEGGGVFITPIKNSDSILYAIAGCGENTPLYICQIMYAFMGEPYLLAPTALQVGAAEISAGFYQGTINYKVGVCGYTAATKKILARFSLAAGAPYRVGTAELNPATVGGWKGLAFARYNGGNYYLNGLCVRFPNNAKPYCVITDEVIGTGDGATRDYALKFGFIKNDGSAVIKVNGAIVDPANYTIDYNKPANNKIGYFLRPVSGTKGVWNHANRTDAWVAGDYEIVENPLYLSYGITGLSKYFNIRIDCSNDLVNWVTNVSGSLATYKNYRYWRAYATANMDANYPTVTDIISSDITPYALHFAVGQAPANGAAITASYRTESICKDVDHVVDIELEITLNEYTG